MRKDSLVAGVLCAIAFGCAAEPHLLNSFSDRTNLTSNRIVIRASSWTLESKSSSEYEWVLEKNAVSKGTLCLKQGNDDGGTTIHYEFPVGVHDDCLAKLEETKFFRMMSAHEAGPPSMTIGLDQATIEVHYHGRRHTVRQSGSAEIDDGFNKMWLFFGDVQKRSTVVKTVQPGAIKRHGTTLRLISGLTPAGTLTPELDAPGRAK